MADSNSKVFGAGDLIDVVRFSDLEKLWQVTAYVCRFVSNLKLQEKGDELIAGNLKLRRFVKLKKCGYVTHN